MNPSNLIIGKEGEGRKEEEKRREEGGGGAEGQRQGGGRDSLHHSLPLPSLGMPIIQAPSVSPLSSSLWFCAFCVCSQRYVVVVVWLGLAHGWPGWLACHLPPACWSGAKRKEKGRQN